MFELVKTYIPIIKMGYMQHWQKVSERRNLANIEIIISE